MAEEKPKQPTPRAPGPHTVNSAAVGTDLVTGAGTITAITMTQPAAGADWATQLSLVDATAATFEPFSARTLFAADLIALYPGNKPNVPLTPGITAPTWPVSLGTVSIPFVNGLHVKSCPANVTFTVTA